MIDVELKGSPQLGAVKGSDPQFEKKLFDSLSPFEFLQLGKGHYLPRMLRGLPRLYQSDCPSKSVIPDAYTDLRLLRRRALDRILCSHYSRFNPGTERVAIAPSLFEGEEWITGEVRSILKGQFPFLKVEVAQGGLELPRGYGQFGKLPLEKESFGLHFLEKGVLTWKINTETSREHRFVDPDHRFFFADITSETGSAIYLNALFKILENDDIDIDLYVPDPRGVSRYLANQIEQKLPLFPKSFGISSLEIDFERRLYLLGKKGKRVRIFSQNPLSRQELMTLMKLSANFVAVSSDLSLTDAISSEKVFFLDGNCKSLEFLKDLQALAGNRLAGYPGVLNLFRGMQQAVLHHMPYGDERWVDESHFQEIDDWPQIAALVVKSLQDPVTAICFKALSKTIREDYSANLYICHLVQRHLCHRKYPRIRQLEEKLIYELTSGKRSLTSLVRSLIIPPS
jgi:hypothetical protein